MRFYGLWLQRGPKMTLSAARHLKMVNAVGIAIT
jgi:hypothetical protein